MSEPSLHSCAACGFRVHAAPAGSGATCPVCGWIDDFEQLVHPDLTYGANSGQSLREAQRAALRRHPSGTATVAGHARDACWRALAAAETPVADPQGPSSPVCYIATPDRQDYVPYWRRTRRS